MISNEVANYYYGIKSSNGINITSFVTEDNVISILNEQFNSDWTYDVQNEIMSNQMISLSINLYVPSRIITGRALFSFNDYDHGHLKALSNAVNTFLVSSLMSNKNVINAPTQSPNTAFDVYTPQETLPSIRPTVEQPVSVPSVQPAPVIHNMTPEQIMSACNPTQNPIPVAQQITEQPIITNNQPNYSSVSFNKLPPPNGMTMEQYNTPLQPNGWSQRQIDALEVLKKELNLKNDDMLKGWINLWNRSFVSVQDLNASNIDEFLNYVENKCTITLGEIVH